jgi:hypothetical protein
VVSLMDCWRKGARHDVAQWGGSVACCWRTRRIAWKRCSSVMRSNVAFERAAMPDILGPPGIGALMQPRNPRQTDALKYQEIAGVTSVGSSSETPDVGMYKHRQNAPRRCILEAFRCIKQRQSSYCRWKLTTCADPGLDCATVATGIASARLPLLL